MSKKSCKIFPDKGKETYKKLSKDFGRDTANAVYLLGISPSFKIRHKNSIVLDKEGIPTLQSLMSIKEIQDVIGKPNIAKNESSKFTPVDNNYNNYISQVTEANKYNQENPDYTAAVFEKEGKLQIVVAPKSEASETVFNNQHSTMLLNNRLLEMFKDTGLTIDMLTDIETSQGKIGITDFSKAKEIAQGFKGLIKVANNHKGVEALSHEFSHLLVAMFKNNPLVQRSLDSLAKDLDSIKQILGEDFISEYLNHDGNRELLAEEALGRILNENLIKQTSLNNLKNKNIFQRLIDYIKNVFSKFSPNTLNNAIIEADTNMSNLAKRILSNKDAFTNEDIESTYDNKKLNALAKQAKSSLDILQHVQDIEIQRKKIFKNSYEESRESRLNRISLSIDTNTNIAKSLFDYAGNVVYYLKKYKDNIEKIDLNNPSKAFNTLREVQIHLESYGAFIDMLNAKLVQDTEAMEKDPLDVDEDNFLLQEDTIAGKHESMQKYITEITTNHKYLSQKLAETMIPVLVQYYTPFISEKVAATYAEGVDVSDILYKIFTEGEDVGFMTRYLKSAASSSDMILQLTDKVIKEAKERVREQTIAKSKEIQQLMLDAKRLGITEFSWMFEKDKKGNKTGKFIQELDFTSYYQNLKDFKQYINDKYGEDPSTQDFDEIKREFRQWHTENTDLNFNIPKKSKYLNSNYSKLSKEQKTILKRYIDLKSSIEETLGDAPSSMKFRVPPFRKSISQRLLNTNGNPIEIFKQIKKLTEDTLIERADDIQEYGEFKTGLTDFVGREFFTVPKLHSIVLEDPNEASEDVIGGLMTYAYSVYNYNAMNEVVSPLEMTRQALKNREYKKKRGGVAIKGVTTIGGLSVEKYATVDPESTRVMKMYDDFIESAVYGRTMKDNGVMKLTENKNINTNKLVNAVLGYARWIKLGFNISSNLAGILSGLAMTNIEAFANYYFSPKDLAKADALYFKELYSKSLEIGQRVKNNKLDLMREFLNIRQDFRQNNDREMRNNLIHRLFGTNFAFAVAGAGDHWLYFRTAIAMMNNTKVLYQNKEYSIYDLLTIEDATEDTKIMTLPEGITNLDGTAFDKLQLTEKISRVNQELFGNYSEEDLIAANRTITGKMLIMYRRYLAPQLAKRYGAQQSSIQFDGVTEGYYRTVMRVGRELIRGQYQITSLKDELQDFEKANIKRAVAELVQLTMMWMLVNLFDWEDDDDDKVNNVLHYFSARLLHEMGGLAPSPMFIGENIKTFADPLPIVSDIQSTLDVFSNLANPDSWTEELQSGPYKGMNRVTKAFLRGNVPIVTQFQSVSKFINTPEEAVKYYIRP